MFRIGAVHPTGELVASGKRQRAFPRDKKQGGTTTELIWGDVRDGGVALCRSSDIPAVERIGPTSNGTVEKKHPDRTLSTKMRAISDLRRINSALRPKLACQANVPAIQDACARIEQIERPFPGVSIGLANRDVPRPLNGYGCAMTWHLC